MSSIVKNKKVSFLDTRIKPQWELLDLKDESGDYEHEFFESVIDEFTHIAGFLIEYYLMSPENLDVIYGESSLKGYDGLYRTKLVYEPTNETTLIDMFGFSNDDVIQYAEMPKVTFERDINEQLNMKFDIDHDPEERKPMPGDVIKTLWDGYMYEISHVSSAEKIFAGKKMIWSFILKPYRYGEEGKDAEDMIFDELDLDDFPEENVSRNNITNEQHREEAEEISIQNDVEYEDDEDTTMYGYFKGLK